MHDRPSASCILQTDREDGLFPFCAPFPVPNLRQVLAVFIDVFLALDEIVLELLLQVDALVARLRRPVDGKRPTSAVSPK